MGTSRILTRITTSPSQLETLWWPEKPLPRRISDWQTEERPTWTRSSGSNYAALYTPLAQGESNPDLAALQGSIVIGGGAKLQLEYELLTHSDVNLLYQAWQTIVVREQSRLPSAFRIREASCLWSLADLPNDFKLVNQLWAVADRQIQFTHQGFNECGKLQRCTINLISVPEVLSYS